MSRSNLSTIRTSAPHIPTVTGIETTYNRRCITKNVAGKFHARKGTSLHEISNEDVCDVMDVHDWEEKFHSDI